MNNLEEKIVKTIKKYNLIENGDKIILAVSGGPDSICMLDVLNKVRMWHLNSEVVMKNLSSKSKVNDAKCANKSRN